MSPCPTLGQEQLPPQTLPSWLLLSGPVGDHWAELGQPLLSTFESIEGYTITKIFRDHPPYSDVQEGDHRKSTETTIDSERETDKRPERQEASPSLF